MSILFVKDSKDGNLSEVVSEFTIRNRFENLKRTRLINRWQVEEIEKLFGENIITSKIPLNNFTEDVSYVNYEEVLEILSSRISSFPKADAYDFDYILKQSYATKSAIKFIRNILSAIDTDYIVNYLKDESKSYVINKKYSDSDPNEPNIIDIRNLELETAFKAYPIWSQAIFTPNKEFSTDLFQTEEEKEETIPSSLITNYFPLLSIFYKLCAIDSEEEIGYYSQVRDLYKPEVYTHSLVVRDLIDILENIPKIDDFLEVEEEQIKHKIYNLQTPDDVTLNPDMITFYNHLKIALPIFQNSLCKSFLLGLKMK